MPRDEWAEFYGALKERTGLDLNLYKQDQLRRRILSMVETRGSSGVADFGRLVVSTPAETQWFLDKLAINVSELFRNPERWAELSDRVLPELTARSSRLKCWSAGCSFGAEAHTLAAVLDARFPGSHTILGTDIDQAALDQARRGVFCTADMRGVPSFYRDRYFVAEANGFRAKDELRRNLTFRRGNLLADRFESGYDLILCRNVVIYFTDEAKETLYRRFFDALRPGGVLFVGSTERIFNSRDLGFETPVPFFYRKPLEGTQSWRNAS